MVGAGSEGVLFEWNPERHSRQKQQQELLGRGVFSARLCAKERPAWLESSEGV